MRVEKFSGVTRVLNAPGAEVRPPRVLEEGRRPMVPKTKMLRNGVTIGLLKEVGNKKYILQ